MSIGYGKNYENKVDKLLGHVLDNFFCKEIYSNRKCDKLTVCCNHITGHYQTYYNPTIVNILSDFQVTILNIEQTVIYLNKFSKEQNLNIKSLIVNAAYKGFNYEVFFNLLRYFNQDKSLETLEIKGLFNFDQHDKVVNLPLRKMKQLIKHMPLPSTLKSIYFSNPEEYDDW